MAETEAVTGKKCHAVDCTRGARMALRTTRPSRADVRTLIYWDERVAPSTAAPYCREHGAELVAQLVPVLTDADERAVPA